MNALIHTLLSDNWHYFKEVNGMAGHDPLLDPLMIASANDLIFLLPLLLLGFWFAFAHWSPLIRPVGSGSSTLQSEQERGLGQRMALLGCAAVALALAFNIAVGHLLYEPRPFVTHPGAVHLLVSHGTDASFPSDHEAVAGAVASMLVLYLVLAAFSRLRQLRQNRQGPARTRGFSRAFLLTTLLTVVALGATATIGVARVYVGVHYPGDILGGIGCGFIAALLVTALRPLVEPVLTRIIQIAERLRLA